MTTMRAGSALRFWLDLGTQALLSLADHRLRTFLSVLGIAIGIAAVVLIGVVSQGGRQMIYAELQTFGLRSIWIYRDRKVVDPRRAIRPGTGIDNDDVAYLLASACCRALARNSPIIYARNQAPDILQIGGRFSQVQIEGIGGDYMQINNDAIILGRGLSDDDVRHHRNYIVIGEQVRQDLFGEQSSPLGAEVRLGPYKFEVIGVLAHKDRTFLSSIGSVGGRDANSRVLLPYTRLQAITGSSSIDVIQGEIADDRINAATATSQVIDALKRRHGNDFEYRAETMEQYLGTANTILSIVSKIGIVAASVSLFVAGLGILNIMGTSVLERTREIGLRKALGGTKQAILLQFLIEATLISTIGGIVGLLLGLVGSAVMVKITGFPLIPTPLAVVLALLTSVAVGLASGFYPAYRAAKLRPAEALRYE